MLGKYSTIMLLAGFAAGALIDPRRRAYFLSAAPWVSALVGGLVLLPNLVWLFQNHFEPFDYAAAVHGENSFIAAVGAAARYSFVGTLYLAVPLVFVAVAARPSRATIVETVFPTTPDRRLLAAIFWVPLLLPLPLAILDKFELVSLWVVPGMALLPAVLLGSPRLNFSREAVIKITAFALAFPVLALLCAPLVSVNGYFYPNPNGTTYYRLLSAAAQQLWRDRTGRPLKVVLGSRKQSIGIAFYSPDHPLANPAGMDADRIKRDGALAVCPGARSECAWLTRMPSKEVIQEVTLSRRIFGWTGKPETFSILVLPPAS